LPHGVLFRGGAEGHIRQFLIEERNWLDAVIGLPANIFFGTSIPTCILVLKKNRTHKGNILFIDASQHFEKVKTQHKLRQADIAKLVSTYTERTPDEKYSYIATLDEVRDNDYNLNIPRYVDTFEAEDAIDLHAISTELKQVAEALKSTDATIARYCDELGIEAPL